MALFILLIVFIALPVRWWPVDLPTVVLAALFGVSAFGLAAKAWWGPILLKVSASVCLALGLSAVAALSSTAAFLTGIHGNLGKNGALIAAFVIGLVLPYLVIYPCAQLLWLHRQTRESETP